jgi:hypothetical protein
MIGARGKRMRPAIRLIAVWTVLAVPMTGQAVVSLADAVVTYRVHADLITLPTRESGSSSGCETRLPQTGDLVTITWTDDRARLDRPGKSVILRTDEGRLYFLFHEAKKYAWIKYPVAYRKYRSPLEDSLGAQMLGYRVESLRGPEKATVLGREGSRYAAAFVNDAGGQWRAAVVLTAELPSDTEMALALRTALHDLRFGGYGWLALLPIERRLPLLWEEALRQPDSEAVYREEATEIVQRPAPPNTYSVPPNYTKVEFDPGCMRSW